MIKNLLALVLFIAFALSAHSQDQHTGTKSDSVVFKLRNYVLNNLEEKVYVTTDKPYYAVGDTIWFQTFLVNAVNHRPLTLSNTIYVDLLNSSGDVLISKILHSKEGLAPGEFSIDEKWDPGTYQIRAYTKWMLNFSEDFIFNKELEIYNIWPESTQPTDTLFEIGESEFVGNTLTKTPEVEIRLFPEGGNLVHGIPTIMAVKATFSGTEEPVAIKGSVFDVRTKAPLATFHCDEYGLGAFVLARPMGQYEIRLDSPAYDLRYQVVPIELGSFSLRVINRMDAKVVRVMLETDMPGALEGAYVIGHVRGEAFCNVALTGDRNMTRKLIALKSSIIPTGIVHFTLFEPGGWPVAERLVFMEHRDQLVNAKIGVTESGVSKREKVELTLQLPDSLEGKATISVTNSEAIVRDSLGESLYSYLMLNSDLKGMVKDPSYYLLDGDRAKHQKLDYLMLTHGWRRFKWKEVLSSNEQEHLIQPEVGLTFSGQLKNYIVRKKVETGLVQFISMKLNAENLTDDLSFGFTETDDNGYFKFNNLYFQDSVKIILQSKKSESKENYRYYIDLDETEPPAGRPIQKSEYNESLAVEFIEKANKAYLIEKSYNQDVMVLDEVAVEARAEDPFKEAIGGRYTYPSYRLIPDSIIGDGLFLIDLLRRIPFIYFDAQNNMLIRGQQAAVYLDGNYLDPDYANSLIQGTPGDDIFFVDVDRSGFSNSRGAAIYIYTKSGNGILTPMASGELPGILHLIHPGYDKAREFYSPYYGPESPKSAKPDYRLQLYWNPQIEITAGGASASFYTGDDKTTYNIVIEGMSAEGKVIMGREQLIVE